MVSLPHQRQTQPATTVLDADIVQLQQDMERLRETARFIANDNDRQQFVRLEHTVNWRLNMLAYVLATQDSHAPTLPQ